MEANELRIGNLIMENGIECVVDTLSSSQRIIVVFKDRTFNDNFLQYSDIQPIPLTEEWLLKFGFEKADEIYFIEFDVYSMTIKEYEKGKYILNPETHFNYVDIEYVHQLQNLYFALTNLELTFKSE